SCCSLKSSLVRFSMICPCLSRTVARTLTTLTSEEKVGVSCAGRRALARTMVAANSASAREDSFSFLIVVMSGALLAGIALANHLRRRGLRGLDPQMQQRSQIKCDTGQPYHGWRQRPRSFQ